MQFEWDDDKDANNAQKHGISFVDAVTVFDDPFHLEEDSSRPEHGEERRKAIGIAGAYFVTVIYTDRDKKRRIISARRARRSERAQYHYRKTSG
jgi:uncharacterized DUF497 family protein